MKRANISIEMMVIAVLAILALVILGFLFKSHVSKSGGQFEQIGENVQDEISGDLEECPQFGLMVRCYEGGCPEGWVEHGSLSGSCESGSCCKRI